MSTEQDPWSGRPKVDALSLTDLLMRRVPTSATKNQEIPFSDVSDFMFGSSVKLIAKESDLPPLVNGFITLEQDKNYIFT